MFEVVPVDGQVALFLEQFAGGFSDAEYLAKHRGGSAKRRLKRHRLAAIEQAKADLDPQALGCMIDEGRPGDVRDAIVKVLKSTDLATTTQLNKLAKLPFADALARAWVAYLAQETVQAEAFQDLRRALASEGLKSPPWAVLTGPRALLYPSRDVCVRASVFAKQLRRLFPHYKSASTPSPRRIRPLSGNGGQGLRDAHRAGPQARRSV